MFSIWEVFLDFVQFLFDSIVPVLPVHTPAGIRDLVFSWVGQSPAIIYLVFGRIIDLDFFFGAITLVLIMEVVRYILGAYRLSRKLTF